MTSLEESLKSNQIRVIMSLTFEERTDIHKEWTVSKQYAQACKALGTLNQDDTAVQSTCGYFATCKIFRNLYRLSWP